LDLQKTYQGSILAAQTELVAAYFSPQNSTFNLDRTKIWKYLDLLEDAKSIDRKYVDRSLLWCSENRSIAFGSIEVGLTEI
jgi:hypothetical protein